MVIKKLNLKIEKSPSTLQDFISKGAPTTPAKNKKEFTNFTIRLPKFLSEGIDRSLHDRIGISKTGWIQEAIDEKIKRENGTD
jgi:hypothetical protein